MNTDEIKRTTAGKVELVLWLLESPVLDENDNETGETVSFIDAKEALRLLNFPEDQMK